MNTPWNTPCPEPRANCPEPRAKQPAWLLLALGALLASIALEGRRAPAQTSSGRPLPPLDLQTASPRELRRLPGIGPARAAAIARLRWERAGQPFELHEIPGIGRVTEQHVLEWLEFPAQVRRSQSVAPE